MAIVFAEFDSYRLWYFSAADTGHHEAMVGCYANGEYKGRIEFYRESTPDSSLRSVIRRDVPIIRYRISRFHDVLQILLHEKPLFLQVDDAAGLGALANDALEPAGEQEP